MANGIRASGPFRATGGPRQQARTPGWRGLWPGTEVGCHALNACRHPGGKLDAAITAGQHPKVAATTGLAVQRLLAGQHVLVLCVWKQTHQELHESITKACSAQAKLAGTRVEAPTDHQAAERCREESSVDREGAIHGHGQGRRTARHAARLGFARRCAGSTLAELSTLVVTPAPRPP